ATAAQAGHALGQPRQQQDQADHQHQGEHRAAEAAGGGGRRRRRGRRDGLRGGGGGCGTGGGLRACGEGFGGGGRRRRDDRVLTGFGRRGSGRRRHGSHGRGRRHHHVRRGGGEPGRRKRAAGTGHRQRQRKCAHRSLLIRSAGLTTSVRRTPKRSLTTTTSPCAIRVPLTYTSSGSPAPRSSSTTEPWLSCSRLRIGIRARPTSSDSETGTSRITSRLRSAPAGPGWPASAVSGSKAARAAASWLVMAYWSGSRGWERSARRAPA